ncbi:MAG: hypothetical protein AAFY71_11880 [Bacteroidota bacterium]
MRLSICILFSFLVLSFVSTSPVNAAARNPSKEEIKEEQSAAPQSEANFGKKRHFKKFLVYGGVGVGVMLLGSLLLSTGAVGVIILVGGTLMFFYGIWHLTRWIMKGGLDKKKKKKKKKGNGPKLNWPPKMPQKTR